MFLLVCFVTLYLYIILEHFYHEIIYAKNKQFYSDTSSIIVHTKHKQNNNTTNNEELFRSHIPIKEIEFRFSQLLIEIGKTT